MYIKAIETANVKFHTALVAVWMYDTTIMDKVSPYGFNTESNSSPERFLIRGEGWQLYSL